MREVILWIALAFCLLFGAATASVAAQYGVDIFTLVSFLIIGMLMLAILGAIRNPPGK